MAGFNGTNPIGVDRLTLVNTTSPQLYSNNNTSPPTGIIVIVLILLCCATCLCAVLRVKCWSRSTDDMPLKTTRKKRSSRPTSNNSTQSSTGKELKRKISAEASRGLGINMNFVMVHFPEQAQEMVRTSNHWYNDSISAEANVRHLDFFALSAIVAYGPLAYGKDFICPRDDRIDCSIVDALHDRGDSEEANLFLSWVWTYKLETALSALNSYCTCHPDFQPKKTFLWWCFFQNNQFRILGDNKKYRSECLQDVFRYQVRRIGRMACMVDKIVETAYLKRLWCLFEVHIANNEHIPMEVMLPQGAIDEIAGLSHKGKDVIQRAFNIDAERASASFKDDEMNILGFIRTTAGGPTAVNQGVRSYLLTNLLSLVESDLARREGNVGQIVDRQRGRSATAPQAPIASSEFAEGTHGNYAEGSACAHAEGTETMDNRGDDDFKVVYGKPAESVKQSQAMPFCQSGSDLWV